MLTKSKAFKGMGNISGFQKKIQDIFSSVKSAPRKVWDSKLGKWIVLGAGAGGTALMMSGEDSPSTQTVAGGAQVSDSVSGDMPNKTSGLTGGAGSGSNVVGASTPQLLEIADLKYVEHGFKTLMENPDTQAAVKHKVDLADRMLENSKIASLDLFARAFGLGNGAMAANAMAENTKLRDEFDKYSLGLNMMASKHDSDRKNGALILNDIMGGDAIAKYSSTLTNIIKARFDAKIASYELESKARAASANTEYGASLKDLIDMRKQSLDAITALESKPDYDPYKEDEYAKKTKINLEQIDNKLKLLLDLEPKNTYDTSKPGSILESMKTKNK